jgi:hypothetical protein
VEIFNIIAGVCSIFGLFVSFFVASKVIKINETINIKGDNNKALNQSNKSGDNDATL